ncbi:hypothetical protein FGIG_03459 [Fasciola gigantica]|uniref:Uncharacterized protein n=1 Tax=Fasciola gigantica TaxID=46835 RepID=A0A504YK41_FASGI|nr:hypothetical protein FGIG_03459 [Fasciola gigantica]
MGEKQACLEKLFSKRIPSLRNELKMQNTKTQSIWSQSLTYLRELDAQKATRLDESLSPVSDFICDQPIAHLCGLRSRYALAVGDYAHQVLSTPRSNELNHSSTILDRSSGSMLEYDISPIEEQSRYVELARLAECKRLTLSLETDVDAEKARLTSQIEWLGERLKDGKLNLKPNSVVNNRSSNSEVLVEVEQLRRHCYLFASELAHLDQAELEQMKIEQLLNRQQTYLQRLDKVVGCAVDENAWNRLFTDLVRLESDSFQKATELLENIERSAESFILISDTLSDRLTTARQTTSERELDQFRRSAVVEKFEQALTKVVRSIPLPTEMQRIRDSGPLTADRIRALLEQLQTRLTNTESSVRQTSAQIAKLIAHLRKQFNALETTFQLSESDTLTTHQLTEPHVDCVQSERLMASAIGLCSPDLLQSLSQGASQLDSLAREIRTLKLESDRVFAFDGNTIL